MKNIINEKPTYTELESKLRKQESEKLSAFLIILTLVAGLALCAFGWVASRSDAIFYKNEYLEKSKRCVRLPQVDAYEQELSKLDSIRLRARQHELSKAENEFRVKQIQWEADVKVREAMLDLRKEHQRLEVEQEKFNNQAKSIDKVINAAK